MNRLLVLRPDPGAGLTAQRARAAGFDPIVAPLFTVGPVAWDAPDPAGYDAVLLTSANAARHGGTALARYAALPVRAVGPATADAARAAGFTSIAAGDGDGAAAIAQAAADGHRRLIHLAGREHKPLVHPGLLVERRIVYAADPAAALPDTARRALADGAIALLHSPRAAALFRTLAEAAGLAAADIAIAAISPAALAAAGGGWRAAAAADRPDDAALLAAAARLCD